MAKDDISVMPAGRDEKPIAARLMQLYLHDFSDFSEPDDAHGLIGEDGLFEPYEFDLYWQDDAAWRLHLIRLRGALAGFACIGDWTPSGEAADAVIEEFFVLRKYRRSGVGRAAALRLFRSRPGRWELGVADYNAPAQAFWRRVVTADMIRDLEELEGDGKRWRGTIFRFRIAAGG